MPKTPTYYIEEFLYRGRAAGDVRPTAWHVVLGLNGTDPEGRPFPPLPIMTPEQASAKGMDLKAVIAEINVETLADLEEQRSALDSVTGENASYRKAAEDRIVELTVRAESAEAQVVKLSARAQSAEARADDLAAQCKAADTTIANLTARAEAAEAETARQSARADLAEKANAAQAADVSAAATTG